MAKRGLCLLLAVVAVFSLSVPAFAEEAPVVVIEEPIVTEEPVVTSIEDGAFDFCGSLTDVYYGGTNAQRNAISMEGNNDALREAAIHYNSAPAPSKLAAPTVKIAQVTDGIKVTWNKITGAPRYMVYYKENGGSWKKIGTTTSTTYTRAAKYLKNGVTYQFTVRCCANDIGPYKASNSPEILWGRYRGLVDDQERQRSWIRHVQMEPGFGYHLHRRRRL